MRRPLLLATALALLATSAMTVPFVAAASSPSVTVAAPARAQRGLATGITITLPRNVAAVDGRLLFAGRSMEVLGIATVGGGTALPPVAFKGGASFGAYGLRPTAGRVRLQLVVVPRSSGSVGVRVVIDSTADAGGRRLPVGASTVAGVRVGRSSRSAAAARTWRGCARARSPARRASWSRTAGSPGATWTPRASSGRRSGSVATCAAPPAAT